MDKNWYDFLNTVGESSSIEAAYDGQNEENSERRVANNLED